MKDVHFEWHLFLSSLPFEEGVSTNSVNKEKVSYINSRLFFKELRNGILLPKLFCCTVRKKCSSDSEKKLKFEAEGREFAKCLKSLEQFIHSEKSEQFLVTKYFFNLFLEVSHI